MAKIMKENNLFQIENVQFRFKIVHFTKIAKIFFLVSDPKITFYLNDTGSCHLKSINKNILIKYLI